MDEQIHPFEGFQKAIHILFNQMLKETNMLIENSSRVQYKELMIYMSNIHFEGP